MVPISLGLVSSGPRGPDNGYCMCPGSFQQMLDCKIVHCPDMRTISAGEHHRRRDSSVCQRVDDEFVPGLHLRKREIEEFGARQDVQLVRITAGDVDGQVGTESG